MLDFFNGTVYTVLVMRNQTITEFLNSESVDIMELWYDWFCRETSLYNKGKVLFQKMKVISNSSKFDNDKCYIFFKNNCPCAGRLFDDFRICDSESKDVLYTIAPSCGYDCYKNKAVVWGRENNFEEPLVIGTWTEVKKWFLKK